MSAARPIRTWLFTPDGFLSIVADLDHPWHLLVRGRVREDVAHFCAASHADDPVETPGRDYRFRVSAPADAVARYVAGQPHAIDYPNFKDEVARRQGHDRAHTYGACGRRCACCSDGPTNADASRIAP